MVTHKVQDRINVTKGFYFYVRGEEKTFLESTSGYSHIYKKHEAQNQTKQVCKSGEGIMGVRRILFILFTCVVTVATGQISAPKYSNEFLSIGVGARAFGLSNAVTSNVADATAAYWNPAGLLQIKDKYDVSLMHAEYFAGIANYDYLGFAMPVDSVSRIAFSIIRFGVDDIPDTRFLYDANGAINYDNIRFFSAADYAFIFSYARKLALFGGVDVGANVKVIHRNVGEFANAWGFGLDAALHKKMGAWDMGVMLRDITGTFNAWSHNTELVRDVYALTGNILPVSSLEVTLPRVIFGASRLIGIGSKIGVMPSVDLEMTFDGKRNVALKTDFVSVSPRVGIEANYAKIAYLRLGAGKFQQTKDFKGYLHLSWQPNFGLGVNIKGIKVDYAMTDFSNSSEAIYSHVFSLSMGINDKKQTLAQ